MKDIKSFEPLFGSWYIDGVIGAGSFGTVYSAHRDTTGERETAAIKHISIPASMAAYRNLRVELNTENEFYIRANLESKKDEILAEYNLQRRFRGYTNFVDCQDISIIEKTDDETPGYDVFIRMEKLVNLAEATVGRRMEPQKAAQLGIDVCRALELLKQENLIHRDLKPQNIFISSNGDYKVGDFGTARILPSGSVMMSVMGTAGFMAPEIAKGEAAGYEADIYSLGIVLYRQLNGSAPFVQTGSVTSGTELAKAEIIRLTGETIPPIPGIPAELNRIVLKACEYDKHNRYRDPSEMKHELEVFCNLCKSGEPLSTAYVRPADKAVPETKTPEKEAVPTTDQSAPKVVQEKSKAQTNADKEPYAAAGKSQSTDSSKLTEKSIDNKKTVQRTEQKPKQKKKLKKFVLITVLLCIICLGAIGYMLLKPVHLTADMVKLSYESVAFNGGVQVPVVTLEGKNGTLTADKDYTLSVGDNRNAGTYGIQIAGKGHYSGKVTAEYTIRAKDISDADVNIEYTKQANTYSGETVTMGVERVAYGAITLKEGQDYQLSGDIDAFTVNGSGDYELTVTGCGNYKGTVSHKWNINAHDLSDASIEICSQHVFDGQNQTVAFDVKIGDTQLTVGTDYDVLMESDTAVNAGTYTLTVRGFGNYTGEQSAQWQILPRSIEQAKITLGGKLTYSGDPLTANILRVELDGEELIKGRDGYKVQDSSDIVTDAGEYTLTIYGTGNYAGQAAIKFKVEPQNIRNSITVELGEAPVFTGDEVEQGVNAVYVRDALLELGKDYKVNGTTKAVECSQNGYALSIEGCGNYTGSKEIVWNVAPASIADGLIELADMPVYDGKEKTQGVDKVTVGEKVLAEGVDYTIGGTYKGVNCSENDYTLSVYGIGNYSGSIDAHWNVQPASIADAVIELFESPVYNGKRQEQLISTVKVGKNRLSSADYEIGGTYNAIDRKADGAYVLILTGKGNYTGTAQAEWNIQPMSISTASVKLDSAPVYDGSEVEQKVKSVSYNDKALIEGKDYEVTGSVKQTDVSTSGYELAIKGLGNYSGSKKVDWNIQPADISEAVITAESVLTYNGKNQRLTIGSVVIDEKELTQDVDYEIGGTYEALSHADYGYTLTLNGIGNYTGKAELVWNIEQASIENAEIVLDNPTYNGKTQNVGIKTIKLGTTILSSYSDYDIVSGGTATDHNEKGYTLTINGKGNYCGTAAQLWNIEPKDMDSASVYVTLDVSPVYNGHPQKQSIKSVVYGEMKLIPGIDYEVTGNEQTDVGGKAYELIIAGKGNYTGEKEVSWNITPKKVANASVVITAHEYTSSLTGILSIIPIAQDVIVDGTVINDTEYEISYSDDEFDINGELGIYQIGYYLNIDGNYVYSGSGNTNYFADRIPHECGYYNAPSDNYCGNCGKPAAAAQ